MGSRLIGGFALAGAAWLIAKQIGMSDRTTILFVGLIYLGTMMVVTDRWKNW